MRNSESVRGGRLYKASWALLYPKNQYSRPPAEFLQLEGEFASDWGAVVPESKKERGPAFREVRPTLRRPSLTQRVVISLGSGWRRQAIASTESRSWPALQPSEL